MVSEGEEQRLVAGEVVENAGQEMRRMCRGAQVGRADSRSGKKTAEPLGVCGDERKRLNRHVFCGFRTAQPGWFGGQIFAFP